jgi:hypothetical protein
MTDDNTIKRIGYRILYDAKGCSFSDHNEYQANFNVAGKYDVQIYFGPKPKHGIQIVSDYSKYYVPGSEARFGKTEFMIEADGSTGCGPFFFETVVSVQTDEQSSIANTQDDLLRHAESRREEFRDVIYLVAGIVGLRFQRQFVLEPFNDNALAWMDDTLSQGVRTPVLENLELISINENGIKHLEALKQSFASLTVDVLAKHSLIFHWLLRAWHERDHLHTFIALFVPLEALLTTFTESKMSAEEKRLAKSIRMLIKKHAGSNAEDLLSFVNRLVDRTGPTLDDRFVDVATFAKLPGWEADIEAFKKFKRMRNMLLHGSDTNVEQKLTVGEEEVRTLQDLVERYVNYCLFRDNNVYQSRWRPQIRETAESKSN